MKKNVLLAIICLSIGIATNAKPVSRNQAKSTAISFLESKGMKLETEKPIMKAKTNATTEEDAYYYVFNASDNKGFVIVSGDDRTDEILGYSDTGTFNEDNIPENMRSWLQYYADQIKYLDDNNIQIDTQSEAKKAQRRVSIARRAIAPILTCLWNQGDPYNGKCPIYYNADGSTGTSATGCIATALAQMLYHHKYPAEVKQRIPALTNTYTLSDGTTKSVTLPAIKKGTAIDWDNMCDTYDGSETQEQKDAVANLMLIVGQAVKMGYGASSGSSYWNAEDVLHKYLGFDDGVYVARNTDYGIQEWFDLIYNEIAAGYPVAYGGSSTGGGHAFVLDGFDGNGCFHVNWGWGGGSNGYFRITVLNPGDNSGIGASSSADGYSMAQDAILNVRAEDDGVAKEEAESDTHASINDTKITGTQIFSNYVNWTGSTNSFDCAIVTLDENGEYTPITAKQTITSLGNNTYVGKTFDVKGCFSAPGKYRISPANKLVANKTWRPLYDLKSEYILAEVDDNMNITLSTHLAGEDLEITNWEFGVLKVRNNGDHEDVTVTIKNNGGEFNKELALYASQTSSKGSSSSHALVGVKENSTNETTFYFKPDKTGTWNLWITLNSDANQVIGQTTVNVTTNGTNLANLSVSSVSCQGSAYGDFLKGSMTVKNNGSKDFAGYVSMQIWHGGTSGGTYWSGESKRLYYEIPAGKTGSADFLFENLAIGEKYRFCQTYVGQSGELGNGGVFSGDEWTTKAGAVAWNKYGSLTGSSFSSSYSANASCAAVWFCQKTPTTVTASKNTNCIYQFDAGETAPSSLDGLNVVIGNEAESINLVDGSAVYYPKTFTAKKATFTYPVTTTCNGKTNWVPLTLPFAPSSIKVDDEEITWEHADADGQILIKEFYAVDDDNVVLFSNADVLRDATPYLLGVPAKYAGKDIVFSAEDVEFKSTMSDMMLIGSDIYNYYGNTLCTRSEGLYVINADGTAFDLLTEKTQLVPFRNYFIANITDAPSTINFRITDADPTGITNIRNDQNSNGIFDLQGRKVINPTKGIYIINGKKVIK